ncbi:MAG: transcriptional regulator, Spx/MgsR family [Anaerocolumna sp.]|jgi:arsenate reductase|nr:transcriptional regulator, Spx/MgsR family [Anaerocolumna sp.]
MSFIFIEYPKCSTCKKAKSWLDKKNIHYIDRDITIQNPKKEELSQWLQMGDLPIKRFFNTSGLMYKDLKLKEKLETLSEDEQLTLLASHGMLVKRPLLIADNFVLIGFNEDKWEEAIKL